MIDWIKKLIKLGVAYETDAGVFLNVRKVRAYGKLSGQTEDEIRLRRLELVPGKKNPEDFSLWNKIRKGCMIWESPWGEGRPGWHIEDTATASKHLEVPYDINIGGDELIFPHHEALRAQVEPIIGRRLCRFWLHNGMLRVRRKKMSKSLGNAIKVREVSEDYTPDDIRFYFLSTHYRKPIDFRRDELRDAKLELARLRQQLLRLETYAGGDEIQARSQGSLWNRLAQSLDDDLDVARALAQLRRSTSSAVDRRGRHSVSQKDAYETCRAAKLLFAILGIPPQQPTKHCS
jgi:cysteinyl-tRNA synthetase